MQGMNLDPDQVTTDLARGGPTYLTQLTVSGNQVR